MVAGREKVVTREGGEGWIKLWDKLCTVMENNGKICVSHIKFRCQKIFLFAVKGMNA